MYIFREEKLTRKHTAILSRQLCTKHVLYNIGALLLSVVCRYERQYFVCSENDYYHRRCAWKMIFKRRVEYYFIFARVDVTTIRNNTYVYNTRYCEQWCHREKNHFTQNEWTRKTHMRNIPTLHAYSFRSLNMSFRSVSRFWIRYTTCTYTREKAFRFRLFDVFCTYFNKNIFCYSYSIIGKHDRNFFVLSYVLYRYI